MRLIYTAAICFLSLLLSGCGNETVDLDKLVERNGVFYLVNSDVGFTGKAVEVNENGKIESELRFRNGKLNGTCVAFHPNGQKESEGTYKDNVLDGSYSAWYENGQRQEESNYKNGVLEGEFNKWFENGQRLENAKVTGIVTLDGEPLAGIRVLFFPKPATGNTAPGPYSTAVTNGDGIFTLVDRYGTDGAMVCIHEVEFEWDELDESTNVRPIKFTKIPKKYESGGSAQFEVSVPSGGLSSLKLKLMSD